MFLKIRKEDIIDGLLKAANNIPSKTGAAYLRTVWLKGEGDTLSILATDSSIEFVGSYPAVISDGGLVGEAADLAGCVSEPGLAVCPALLACLCPCGLVLWGCALPCSLVCGPAMPALWTGLVPWPCV